MSKTQLVRMTRQAVFRYGEPVEITPEDAILALTAEAWGNVSYLREELQRLGNPLDDVAVPEDAEGRPSIMTALFGPEHHASGVRSGGTVAHVLVQLYNEERDRALKTAEVALKSKAKDRQLQMQENDARTIFAAVSAALARMGLGERFDEFRAEFAAALNRERPAVVVAAGGEPG